MTAPGSAFSRGARRRGLYAGSILISLAVATLLVAAFLPRLYHRPLSTVLLTLVLIALTAAIALHVRFLILARREQRETARALSTTEHEFQAIFDSALDALLILDDQGICLEANPAALILLGARRDQLVAQPISKFQPHEQENQKEDIVGRNERQGEMQVLRQDGQPLFVEYSAKSNYLPHRHFVALRDITARKSAEDQMSENLRLAESARAEADALRRTTLALTQNLSMDYVLDTLLQSLMKLIPCDSAQVLLAETQERLFLARERHSPQDDHQSAMTWNAPEHPPLMQVLSTQDSLLVGNTARQSGWSQFKGHRHFRSWLCVPLVASQSVLGLLSLGDSEADTFTGEHLRLAESLALPAAAAIQNARLYEQAEIYGTELEKHLADLERTQQALQKAEEHSVLSEDKFTKVFRASPIAFSITTVEGGRVIDVNEAFERRYGYSRDELIGRTTVEIGIWDDPEERPRMIGEIRERGCIRNHATRLRNRSGEAVETIYSAQIIHLDGQVCILAVTEDLPDRARLQALLARASSLAR
ncbi:MAG: PAS domain S-box protein [Candidatus Acidiferrales bacterium]|jgi:PAS domain S-box-containing protein